MCDPTGLVAALGGDVCQHGVPFGPLERAVAHARLAALDEPEFAVGGHNELGRALRQEAAIRARLAAHTNMTALRAFEQLGLAAALPLLVFGRRGLPVGIERPGHPIFG